MKNFFYSFFSRSATVVFLISVLLLEVHAAQPGNISGNQPKAQLTPIGSSVAPVVNSNKNEKKVALVLSGGGARGLAHIGVLKALQELQIPVDIVTGTSMGSIIGGAFAQGMPLSELEAFAGNTQWSQIFVATTQRNQESFTERDSQYRNPSRLEFGFDKEGLHLPEGTFGSTMLESTLRHLTAYAPDTGDSRDLPIPFAVVATDIAQGTPVILHGPDLFSMLRASMAVPGAFAPIRLNGKLLVDGGVVRNFPIQEARAMGATHIIAVDVSTPLKPETQVKDAFAVLDQVVSLITVQNTQASIQTLTEADTLITPDLEGVSFLTFENTQRTIALGYEAAMRQREKLLAFAKPQIYSAWQANRQRLTTAKAANQKASDNAALRIASIKIEPNLRANPAILEKRLDLDPNKAYTRSEIERHVQVLNSSNEYQRIDWNLTPLERERLNPLDTQVNPNYQLNVSPVEGAFSNHRARIGLRLASDFSENNTFDLNLLHRKTWVNSLGAEWGNEIQLGEVRRFASNFKQPITAGSPWFGNIGISSKVEHNNAYLQDELTALTRSSNVATKLQFGRTFGNTSEIRLGAFNINNTYHILLPMDEIDQRQRRHGYEILMTADTLNSSAFPTQGYRTSVNLYHLTKSLDDRRFFADISALNAVEFGQWSLLAQGIYAKNSPFLNPHIKGGLLRLSGTPEQISLAQDLAFARVMLSRQVGTLPTGVGGAVRLGASLEAMHESHFLDSLGTKLHRSAAAAFLTMDTRFGPIWLGAGKTFDGQSKIYFILGNP